MNKIHEILWDFKVSLAKLKYVYSLANFISKKVNLVARCTVINTWT